MNARILLLLVLLTGNCVGQDLNQTHKLSDEILSIFGSAQIYLFRSQTLINSKAKNKDQLFGKAFIDQLKLIHQQIYHSPFPAADHPIKAYLLNSMIAVMDDNKALILDKEIDFKGFIPAVFAFQLSQRFSNGGYPVSIKFVGLKDRLVNELNVPDQWETSTLTKMQGSHWRTNEGFREVTASKQGKYLRTLQPIYHKQQCLTCHGSIADNPVNKGKAENTWSTENKAGFTMQNFKLNELAGGVSLSVGIDIQPTVSNSN